MCKAAIGLAAVMAATLPSAASGQISFGVRAGTLGLGGEVSVGLGRHLAVRGGIGVISYQFESDLSDIHHTVTFPKDIWNVGVDLYPFGGGFRVTGGFLYRPAYTLEATGQQTADIGDRTYTGEINIRGSLSNENEVAPYGAIGFGRATGRGVGFFIDIGAAFMGDATLEMKGTCIDSSTGQSCPDFEANLERERQEAEVNVNDEGFIVRVHPILQIGVRVGF